MLNHILILWNDRSKYEALDNVASQYQISVIWETFIYLPVELPTSDD